MGPFGTRSGYGDHARDIFHSFHESNKYDIVVWDTRWGDTPRNALNPKNKKRRLHGDFYGGKDNLKRYAEAWPEKQKWLIPKIENLFKAVDKKGHFTWDTAKRFQRKKNKIHD